MKRFLLSMALLLALCVPWTQQVRADYCSPGFSYVDGNGIINVTFGTGTDVVNNSISSLPSPYYGNYTSMQGAAPAGLNCDVEIKFSTGYTYVTIIWIDWNNNETFDGNEVVYVGEASATKPTTLTASFTVPVTQAPGSYRMRIASADSYYDNYKASIAAAASANPCPTPSYNYGVVHDYTLKVVAAPSCLPPTGLSASNITAYTADFSWTAGKDETQYQYVIVKSGVTPDWSSPSIATTTSCSISSLDPNDNYDFYVRSYCDESEQSAAAKVTFRTACAALTASDFPHVEGFEDATVGSSSSAGDFVPCWGHINNATSQYSTGYPFVSTYAPRTGSNHLYFYATSYVTNQIAVLPELNASVPANTIKLKFWAKLGYSSYGAGVLDIGVMTDPEDASTFTSVQQVTTTSSYAEYIVSLAGYTGSGSYVAIKLASSTANSQYVYVDDVTMDIIPACEALKSVSVSNIERMSLRVNWEDYPGITNCEGYQVVCSTTNDPESATPIDVTSASTKYLDINGLERNTKYYIFVRSNCGTQDGPSAWISTSVYTANLDPDCSSYSEESTLTTGSSAVQYVPWGDNYKNYYTQQIYTAAELTALGVQPGYITSVSFQYAYSYAFTKDVTIFMGATEETQFSSSFLPVTQACQPVSTLFNTQGTWYNFELTSPFYWNGESNVVVGFLSMGTSYPDYGAATFYGGTTTNQMAAYTRDDSSSPVSITSITKTTNRANIKFNVCGLASPCPAVKNVTISDSTQTTANISWTAATGDYANDYDVLVSTTPVTDFSAVIPRHTGLTSTTDTLQGLTPYTDYYVYVRVNCNAHGHNDSLAWSEAAYFKTLSNCITPSNLNMQLRGKTTGMVTWTATTQANNYRYILSTTEVADPDNAPTTATSIAADSVLLTGLTPGTHYYFYLSNACGGSDGNSPYMLLEFTTPDACIAPEDVTITDIQKYQMTLTWTASTLADPTDSYDIIVSPTQVTEFEGVVPTYTGVTGTSKVLDSLQRNTEYYVYIRTNCGETTTYYTEVIAKTLDLAPACKDKQIGTGTETTSYYFPFSTYYHNSYTQQVYSASELGLESGVNISSLTFNYFLSTNTTRMITVYLANAPSGTSVSTGWYSTGLTEVYSAKATTFSSKDGWYTLQLDNDFEYTGGDIVVAMYMTYNSCETQYNGSYRFYLTSGGTARYANSDTESATALPLGTNHVPTAGGSSVNYRPNIKFHACGTTSPCPALKNAPTSSNITNTNATLTWNTGKGDWASSYAIYRSTTEITDFTTITPTVDNIADTTYTFTDLTANTHYYMYVRVNCKNAKYDDGSSLWSPACNFTTELPCLRPTDFVAGNPTSYSVPLSWVEHNGATTWNVIRKKGEVYDTISVNASKCTIIGNDTVNYVDSTNIEPKTTYTYYLQTNCQADSLSKMAVQTPIVTTLNNVIGISNFQLYGVDVTEDIFIDTENNQISAGLRKGTDRSNISFNITYADYNCKGYVGDTALFQNSCNFSDVVEVYVYAEDTTIAPEVWYFDIYEEECASPYDFNVPDSTIQRRSAVLNWKVNDNTATNFDFIISDTAVVNFEAWTAPQSITAENNEGNCTYALTGIYRDSTYYVYVRNNCGASTSQWRGGSFTTPGLIVCENKIVSNGTVKSTDVPLYCYYLGSSYYTPKSQFIYISDSLTSLRGKSLSKMTFFTDRDNDYGTAIVEARLGITTADNVYSAYQPAPSSIVYSGNVVITGNKWVLDFGDNTFDYPEDGGNLLVQIQRTTVGNISSTFTYFYGTNGHPYGISRYTDYSENALDFLPKVEFESCKSENACPDIQAIRTSEVGTDSLIVSWTPTAGDYPGTSEIKVSKTKYSDPATEITSADATTVDTLYVIKDLDEYTHYYIYVRTHCNGEEKEDGWTNWIMTDTITESNCPYPRNVAVVMTGKTTARLSWTNEMGVVFDDEDFEYAYSTTEAEPASGTLSNTGYGDLIDLSNSTTYYCYVRKDCGGGSKSPWIKTTITTVPVMPAVVNLAASDTSYNAFRATWNMDHARFANETSWKYACVATGTTPTPTAWTTTSDTSAIIYGLSESTPYDLYLLPLDDLGTSGDTAMITVTTTAVPANCKTIGTGTTTQYGAISASYGYERNVILYTAADGLTQGTIESLSFHLATAGESIPTKVYLKNTTLTDISSVYASSFNNAISDATLVYDATVTTIDGWLTLDITDFEYTGDNLMVLTANNFGGYASNGVYAYYTQSGSNNNCYVRKDNSIDDNNNMSSFSTKALNNNRPNIQFCFVPESCTKPNHLVVDNITTSSARASWYPGDNETSWIYYVSNEELTDDELDTLFAHGQTTPTTQLVNSLIDLTKDMDYYFYVGKVCVDDDTVWANKFFQTLPTCSAPITAQADNTGDNEITFDATFGQYGTVGTYDFWYWKVGTTDTVKVNGQTSQIVETNVPGGDYNWQVRANCGDVDGMSRWTAGNRVRVCGVYNLPYTQGFEDIPTDYSGPGMINPICWNDQRASTYDSPHYEATTEYKTEGSKSLKMYSKSAADSLFLIMPYFQNVTDCRVKFDGMVENRNYSGNILVGYMTTDSLFVPSYTLQPTGNYVWKSATAYVRNIPAGARVAFCYSPARSYNTYYGFLDNIAVDTIPVYNVASAIAPADPVLGSLTMECAAIDTVSAGRFYENAKPVFTATPNYGMKFTNWTNGNNGDTINTVNPWTLTVTADTSIIANFDTASFNLNVNIASGSESLGTVSGSGNFKYLSENQITATANEHYHVIWNDGNRDAVRTITMPGKDTTLTATFAIDSFTVTTTQNVDSMGTISGAGSYPYAATATLEATPADHHHFVEWSNGEITPQINVEVVQDTNLHATFRLDTIYVTALSNDDNLGQVSGSGYHGYNRPVTLKAHPEPHYHLKNWSNGMTGDEITIYPTSDTTITAYFVIDTFTVTAVANPSATGTFTGTGKYPYGASVSVKAIANEHYHFVDWENGSTDTTQTFEMPAYDTTITANFRIDTVLITAIPSQVDRGTIQINSIDTTTLWVDYGSQVTVEATAIYPYSFKKWDNDTLSNPYTFTAEGDKTLKAMLTYNEFVIAVNSNNESMGTVTGSATLSFGNIDTITATPKAHHHFIRWTGGSTDNPSYLAVTKDTSITGYFGIDSFTVIAVPNVPTMGTVTGGDIYPYNTPVTVTATPAAHHHFLGWSNGVAATSLNWNITEDSLVVANFAIDQHTVAVSANDAEMGSVTGSGTYNYGTQVTITATPANDHFAFDQWSNGDRNATTTIDLAGDTSVTAIFTADTHDVTLLMNGAGMGSVDGAGNYAHGAQATISATANDHYHFVDWSNGLTTATANIIVDDDTTITANFAIDQHNVSVIANDAAMGTVTGSGIYNYGASADLVATPAANHHFVGWDNNITTATQTVNVSSDSIIIATFAIDRHNVTVSANDPTMGSVTGTGLYDYGTQVTITATPADEHYSFVQWSNGDNTATTTITLTQDTAITAIFSADTHDVTLNVNDATMGSVAGSGNYAHGATAAISATPNAHYSFVNWSNGITTPTANIVVDRDTVITANFAVEQHSVIAQSNDPAKGSVTGSGTYSYGAIANLVATPAAHNHFVAWSDGFDNVSYSLNVASDTTVIATFAIDQHNVVATPNNPALGSVTGSGLYDYGTEVTLTATPLNAHSTFVNWSDGQTTPTISFTLTQDVNITAIFSVDSHLITVNSNNPSMGAVTGGGTYNHGATADLTATPNDHYHFLGWSNGMSTPNYSIVVDRDSVFTAMFAIDEHNVTAYSNNTAMGSVTGAGTYEYNTDATLVATPVAHHHFVDWSNGVTNATQIVRVVSDTDLVANFAVDEHNVTVKSSNLALGKVTGSGQYGYGSQVTITATPTANASFTGWSNGLINPTAVINLTKDTVITAYFVLNQYTLTVNSNDESMGTATGGGSYAYGDGPTLKATPASDCYRFVRWSDGSTVNPRKYTVTESKTITAIFAVNEHTLSVASNNTAAGIAYIDNNGTPTAKMRNIACGTLVDIYAVANEFYRFVDWSDGVTDAVRTIDLRTDSNLVARFEANCGDYADLPVQFLYNGLVMLDLDSVKARGYNPQANQVSWYQVVGDVDPLGAQFPADDKFICTGYYLSLPTNNLGYGQYYAVVDVSNSPEAICHDKMRTVVVDYFNDLNNIRVEMAPTNVKSGDIMTITGLIPEENTTIIVYDYTGKTIDILQTEGLSSYDIRANGAAGVYMVKVTSESVNETLRFIINK